MRICLLAELPRLATSETYAVVAALAERGARVEFLPGEGGEARDLDSVDLDYDLFLFKSGSPAAEAMALAAHRRGAIIVNDYAATIAARNPAVASLALRWAGVPAPKTFVTRRAGTLRRLVGATPLELESTAETGRITVRDESELDAFIARAAERRAIRDTAGAASERNELLVAKLIDSPERARLRVHVIGDHFASIGAGSPSGGAQPLGEDHEAARLARRCASALGLGLFAIEVAETPAGYTVLGADPFPDSATIPNAGDLIAEHVLRVAAHRADTRPLRS